MPPLVAAQGAKFNDFHLITHAALVIGIVRHKLFMTADKLFKQGVLDQRFNAHDNCLVAFVADHSAH